MILIRKQFSNKKKEDREKRSESDKKWDSVLGAGLGATAGVIGSKELAKVTKELRNTSDDDFIRKANEKGGFYEKGKKLKDIFSNDYHLSPDEVIDQFNKRDEINLINEKSKKALKRFKLKRGVAKVGIASLPIAGAVIGSLYGRDNNLKKQRNKIEDAAGDKVVEIIKGSKK